jgi:hypothetical protein
MPADVNFSLVLKMDIYSSEVSVDFQQICIAEYVY